MRVLVLLFLLAWVRIYRTVRRLGCFSLSDTAFLSDSSALWLLQFVRYSLSIGQFGDLATSVWPIQLFYRTIRRLGRTSLTDTAFLSDCSATWPLQFDRYSLSIGQFSTLAASVWPIQDHSIKQNHKPQIYLKYSHHQPENSKIKD